MLGVSELSSALFGGVEESRSELILTGLSQRDDSPQESFVLQYFPETINDTKAVNYQRKEVVGGSLPLYQWINSGERLISFQAYMTSDVDLLAQGAGQADAFYDRLKSEGLERRNPDIRTAAAHLRSYTLPTYGQDAGLGTPRTFAPRKVRLTIARSGIGLAGGVGSTVLPDSVFCVMLQCDLTWQKLFPSGYPRIMQFQISLAQIPQRAGSVEFVQDPREYLPAVSSGGGGNSLNAFGGALNNFASSLSSALGGGAATLDSLQGYSIQPRKLKG